MKTALFFLSLLLSFNTHADEIKAGKVTLPIEEYTRLKDETEAPSLTVIEDVQISGEYGKALKLTVSGARSGKPNILQFMEIPKGNVHNCSGNAVIQKDNTYLNIIAQSGRFTLNCSVTFPNWNEANVTFINALYVNAKITGGDVILSGEPSRQYVAFTRMATNMENDRGEVTSVGHYRVTVLPEESKFHYSFMLSNPSRSKKSFSIPFKNGEIVQTVSTEAEYKDSSSEITFSLLPGMNKVTLQGRLGAVNFKAPLEKSQNFMLIENSPMLQLTVNTKARRVSVQDSGMTSQYSTSRAYILNASEEVSWTAKKLEVFASTGYSINKANYTVYVPRDGSGIIEAAFQINNQGTPEIPLKVPGRVTYVEVGGMPQVLLKDASNALLLQVPTGVQNVLIQYEGEAPGNIVASMIGDQLAKPDTTMSDVSVSVQLAPKWNLLTGRSLSELKSDIDFSGTVFVVLVCVFLGFLLMKSGFTYKESVLTAVAASIIAIFINGGLSLIITALVVAAIIRFRHQIKAHWPQRAIIQVFAALLFGVGVIFIYATVKDFGAGLQKSDIASDSDFVGASYDSAARMKKREAAPAVLEEGSYSESEFGGGKGGASTGSSAEPDYQGLPARIKIPSEGRMIYFNQGMLDKSAKAEYKLFVLADGINGILVILALVWIAYFLYREHRKIRSLIQI